MTGIDLLAWTQTLLLDGDLAKAEPRKLRYRLLHVAAAEATAAIVGDALAEWRGWLEDTAGRFDRFLPMTAGDLDTWERAVAHLVTVLHTCRTLSPRWPNGWPARCPRPDHLTIWQLEAMSRGVRAAGFRRVPAFAGNGRERYGWHADTEQQRMSVPGSYGGGMDHVDAGVLSVAYLEDGPADGWPVVLSHGFPYDVHAYDQVVPVLTAQGARVIRPYLRGFGPTRFRSGGTVRSGQQAALGSDLVALADALGLDRPIVAGYDWGGLASCVAAALWPGRVAGLVSLAGYDIIDVERQRHAFEPDVEHAVWYQHLFQTDRGRESLAAHRRELCRMLWRQWSPRWEFDEATFARTAGSFDNPDFADVVVHHYRHALGRVAGDPAYYELETHLAARPRITVPAVTLDGATDTLKPGGTAGHAPMFAAAHEHRVVDAGHNVPQEAPAAFADAVLTVHGWVTSG